MIRKRHRLPNNETIFHQSKQITDWSYQEIFEDEVYLQHGIALEDGDCVFDVGANIGLFSLYVSEKYKDISVYAFEPIQETFELLRLNLMEAGPQLHPLNCGLSNRRGTSDFTFYSNSSLLSTMYPHDPVENREKYKEYILNNYTEITGESLLPVRWRPFVVGLFTRMFLRARTVTCELRTVSDVIEEYELNEIDLLKIDAEGAEQDLFNGIQDGDWGKIRQIAVEVHDADQELGNIVDMFTARGYESHVERNDTPRGEAVMVYAIRT